MVEVAGRAHLRVFGKPLDGHRRLRPQTRGERQLDGVPFGAPGRLLRSPTPPIQFRRHDRFGLALDGGRAGRGGQTPCAAG